MVIGVLQFELLVPGSESLKDKRAVVRSVRDRLSRELRVSIAEVDAHDTLDMAVMGLACAARDGKRAHEILDAAWNTLTKLRDGQVGAVRREIIVPSEEGEAPAGEAADPHDIDGEMLAHFSNGESPDRDPNGTSGGTERP
ncbi:MAG: DUF503 domain-containing protein [Planctomycetota bacterium]